MPTATLAQTSKEVIQYFQKFNIKISPSSRIAKMTSALVDSNGKPKLVPVNSPEFQVAKQAIKDVQSLHFILEQIDCNNKALEANSLLKSLCKDNVEPNLNPTRSKGRDAQCELFFYAICLKANLSPVLEEPDIRCTFNSIEYGLPVKRIKSLDSLEGRIREAGNQVFKARMPGIIVADPWLATNRQNSSIDFPAPEHTLSRALRQRTDYFVSQYQSKFEEWLKHKWVTGIILLFHDLCLDTDGHYKVHANLATIRVTSNAKRERMLFEFSDQFKTGLP